MQVFCAPLMQNRMCLLQWSTRPKKNSESSAAIQIYVPEPRHPFPMSLCKKITFLSYKLTGIIAVEEASASCCTLKLWVACCQGACSSTFRTCAWQGSVWWKTSDKCLWRYLQSAWGKELASLASNIPEGWLGTYRFPLWLEQWMELKSPGATTTCATKHPN